MTETAPHPRPATGIITYRDEYGEIKTWAVGCTDRDTAETLRVHLKKWLQEATFVRGEIRPDAKKP